MRKISLQTKRREQRKPHRKCFFFFFLKEKPDRKLTKRNFKNGFIIILKFFFLSEFLKSFRFQFHTQIAPKWALSLYVATNRFGLFPLMLLGFTTQQQKWGENYGLLLFLLCKNIKK